MTCQSSAVSLPRHIALIMDGNTRWAQQQGLQAVDGHAKGVQTLRETVEHCARKGIQYLTVFAFSSENWRRSEEEISGLMELFVDSLQQESGQLARNGIALHFIGERHRFSDQLRQLMEQAESMTPEQPDMTLILAIDYGGRQDIANACIKLAQKVQAGECLPEEIDENKISGMLSLADIPDPELCIRTSNEHRISNFLLWQMAYTELYFSPVLWPDFDADALDAALDDFANRQRRYGRSSLAVR